MPERRSLWPLLAYGALGAIAFARRGDGDRPSRLRSSLQLNTDTRFGRDTRPAEPAAQGTGRGRSASAPWGIPWAGWKDILWRTSAKISDNRLMSVSAGVVFYGLLAMFPAIAVFVSLYGLFANPSTIDSQISALSGVLPGGALSILHDELSESPRARGRTARASSLASCSASGAPTPGPKRSSTH